VPGAFSAGQRIRRLRPLVLFYSERDLAQQVLRARWNLVRASQQWGPVARATVTPAPNLTFYSGKRTVFDVLSEQSVTWKLYQYGLLDDLAMPARGSLAANPLEISDNLTPSLTSVQFWNIPKSSNWHLK